MLRNRMAISARGSVSNPCAACPVRELSVCAVLTTPELDRMNAIAVQVNVAPEAVVVYEADAADYVFNVTEGTVRLSKMLPDGRRQITGFLSPGDFLGIAFSDTYAYTAEAVSALTLCRFPRTKLEGLFDDLPGLEKRVLGVASNELMAAQDQMLLLGRKTAREKLSTFLWKLRDRAAERGATGDTIELPMNRTDIADYLGLTTETVSRTFTRLVKDGILALPAKRRVVLRDADRLREFATGEP